MCVNNLPKAVTRLGVEPATSGLQVRHINVTLPSCWRLNKILPITMNHDWHDIVHMAVTFLFMAGKVSGYYRFIAANKKFANKDFAKKVSRLSQNQKAHTALDQEKCHGKHKAEQTTHRTFMSNVFTDNSDKNALQILMTMPRCRAREISDDRTLLQTNFLVTILKLLLNF